jgi:pyruvate/2-oxoglutarate dehydrogenase complex dihydrolipoamide acyltransferase (E2) component
MKVGAENRRQLIILGVLLAVAATTVARMVFTWGHTPAEASAAAPAPAQASATQTARPAAIRGRRPTAPVPAAALAPSADPRLRLDLLKYSEDMQYEGNGRNIFEAKMEEIPKIITPPDKKKTAEVPPPIPIPTGPPPPPPINLKFFGFANRPGEPKKVFLSKNDDVFIAGEGEIVDRRYKVLRISPNSVDVEDVLNNQRQTLPLTPST